MKKALWLVLLLGCLTGCATTGGTVVEKATGSPESWHHREFAHYDNARLQYYTTILKFKREEPTCELERVVTPIGEYIYTSWPGGGWPNEPHFAWLPPSRMEPGATERTTLQAADGSLAFSAEEQARGWYFGAFDQRHVNAPDAWGYCVPHKFWFDPVRQEKIRPLLRAVGEMAKVVSAVEQYRVRTGNYPADLKLLVTGPVNHGRVWEPLAADYELIDPWDTPYDIEVLAHIHARDRGLEFEIISSGEDHVAGTADDLSAPDPVNPRPPLYEGREGKAMRINEGIGLVDDMSAGEPRGNIREGSVAEEEHIKRANPIPLPDDCEPSSEECN